MATKAQIAAAAVAKAKAAAAKAKVDKAKAKADAKKLVPSYQVFTDYFKPYFADVAVEAPWLKDLYTASTPFYKQGLTTAQIPDQVLASGKAPASFKARFAGIEKLKQRQAAGEVISYIPSIADYGVLTREIKQEFQKYGLNKLGSNENITDIIGNNVSLREVQERLSGAFDAIDNADEYLKAELAKNFPTLGRQDLAMALVGGPDSAKELQKKVATANVRAAASEFGMQTQTDAEELAKMGVTRDIARTGYAQTQQEIGGLQAAQQQFGGNVNLAKELENVNILGKSSSEVKRLKSQARGQFAGSSGIGQGSLSRRRTGQL